MRAASAAAGLYTHVRPDAFPALTSTPLDALIDMLLFLRRFFRDPAGVTRERCEARIGRARNVLRIERRALTLRERLGKELAEFVLWAVDLVSSRRAK